jgi:ubiquinone/menaquinone biosynthesis C-methylase UbiE
VCDVEHLPFSDGVVDLVDCTAVIEYTPSPRALVAEIRRCVKTGDGCHLAAPFLEYPRAYWRFNEGGLCELAKPMEVLETGVPVMVR